MSKLFLGGIPTELDVRRLLEAFPDLFPNRLIPYDEVAKVIKAEHGTTRFRTVTNAWRRALLRTQNIVIRVAAAGNGFERITEIQRSESDRAGWRKDQSRAARKVRDLARIDTREFDDGQQKAHDHARRVLQAHVEHTSSTVRELAPPPPMKLLPRRAAPGEK